MKKNFKIISMFLLLLLFTSISFAYTNVTNFKPKYGILTSRTNFRAKATTSSKIISTLAKGTAVKIVGQTQDFYIVQLSNNQVGYVSKNYVKTNTSAPQGAKTYTNISPKIVTISDSNVNLRRGPGTSFTSITKLNKGTNIKIIGSIDNFYLGIMQDYTVGMISKDFINLSRSKYNITNSFKC